MFCLIRPPGVETFRLGTLTLTPPLAAAYIAGALEAAGQPVHVVDAVSAAPKTHTGYFRGYLVGLPLEEIVQRVPGEARIVGISCVFTHEWPMVVRLIELIKRDRPELPVVVGGEHLTSMPEFSLATSRADVLVLGEGEETVIELVSALAAGSPLGSLSGVAYREEDRIRVNARRARRATRPRAIAMRWVASSSSTRASGSSSPSTAGASALAGPAGSLHWQEAQQRAWERQTMGQSSRRRFGWH